LCVSQSVYYPCISLYFCLTIYLLICLLSTCLSLVFSAYQPLPFSVLVAGWLARVVKRSGCLDSRVYLVVPTGLSGCPTGLFRWPPRRWAISLVWLTSCVTNGIVFWVSASLLALA
jgi:hypothetical protein